MAEIDIKVSPDLKKLVTDSVTGKEKEVGEGWDSLDVPGKKAVIDGGGEAIRFTAAEMQKVRKIGADVSEQLEFVPSHFKVIRHVRPKLACVACQSIFQALAPSRPIVRAVLNGPPPACGVSRPVRSTTRS